MARILKRPQAEADLDEIWWYIAQDNPDNADRFLERIEKRCLELAQFPHMGTSREELMPALRSLAVGNYLIFLSARQGRHRRCQGLIRSEGYRRLFLILECSRKRRSR